MTSAEREEHRNVLRSLRGHARILAQRFELPFCSLEAERPQVTRRYGVCYSDGSIRVRLRHARSGRLLKYSALIDTLCHELAHLRYFHHGLRFQGLYRSILEDARRISIYRPAPRGERTRPSRSVSPPRSAQLELF